MIDARTQALRLAASQFRANQGQAALRTLQRAGLNMGDLREHLRLNQGLGVMQPANSGAAVPASAEVVLTPIVEGVQADWKNMVIYIQGNPIKIIPAVFSAIVVKAVMFGGGMVASAARRKITGGSARAGT